MSLRFTRGAPLKRLTAVSLILLGCGGGARGGDFSLAYAITIRGDQQTGVTDDCVYATSCKIVVDRLGLTMMLTVERLTEPRHATIAVYGRDHCCYFGGGDGVFRFDPRQPMHQEPLFAGISRKGLEVILNERVGDIYIGLAGVH